MKSSEEKEWHLAAAMGNNSLVVREERGGRVLAEGAAARGEQGIDGAAAQRRQVLLAPVELAVILLLVSVHPAHFPPLPVGQKLGQRLAHHRALVVILVHLRHGRVQNAGVGQRILRVN